MIIHILGVLLLACIAYLFKKLSLSGMMVAIVIGVCIALGLGLEGLFVLAAFFISSTFWSSYKKNLKETEIVEKDGRRDGWQVIANGGVAAFCSLLFLLTKEPLWIGGFIGALAAANSDTWSSENGSLSKSSPYHILKRKYVERGTSGAISIQGLWAGVLGAFFIAATGTYLLYEVHFNGILMLILLFTISGLIGNLMDTLFGAVYQVEYRCTICKRTTEQLKHCQRKTVQIKGISFVNNDIVNLACTLTGAASGTIIFVLIS
ncbi:DUF92 domain-containing protein [Alkalihalobacterium elongatum]|uniref:DUF92 domain-containing protein n=1 Tax=Alkalihalobacterium elongatum TaxID=2675466 RepID=UPI001F3A61CA|nr:DUF92 domain-containing protein [Alkalihalobacterium elongatum]